MPLALPAIIGDATKICINDFRHNSGIWPIDHISVRSDALPTRVQLLANNHMHRHAIEDLWICGKLGLYRASVLVQMPPRHRFTNSPHRQINPTQPGGLSYYERASRWFFFASSCIFSTLSTSCGLHPAPWIHQTVPMLPLIFL